MSYQINSIIKFFERKLLKRWIARLFPRAVCGGKREIDFNPCSCLQVLNRDLKSPANLIGNLVVVEIAVKDDFLIFAQNYQSKACPKIRFFFISMSNKNIWFRTNHTILDTLCTHILLIQTKCYGLSIRHCISN